MLIVFDKYQVPSNDTGDFYTIDSYTEERYSTDIPTIDSWFRASDTLILDQEYQIFLDLVHHLLFQIEHLVQTISIHHLLLPQMKVQ